jgi:hypothetical protein
VSAAMTGREDSGMIGQIASATTAEIRAFHYVKREAVRGAGGRGGQLLLTAC